MTSNHLLPKFKTEIEYPTGATRWKPIKAHVAEAIFIEAGLELLEPYGRSAYGGGGTTTTALRARCTRCGYEGKRSLYQLTRLGSPCVSLEGHSKGRVTGCLLKANLEEFRAYGLEPVDWSTYRSVAIPIECRCTTCGTTGKLRLETIRNSVEGRRHREPCFQGSPCEKARPRYSCPEGCECHRHAWNRGGRLDSDEAAEQMRAVGFEPLEPYPGTNWPWKCRHSCGAVLKTVRHQHITTFKPKYCSECGISGRPKITASQITALLEAKELEPLDPSQLNGGATGPIDCVHLPCGKTTRVAYHLLKQESSSGCAKCAGIKRGLRQRLPRVMWEKTAKKAQMTLLGEPSTKLIPVLMQCNRCGNTKPTSWQTISRGGGCGPCNISASKLRGSNGHGGYRGQRGVLYLLSDRQGALKIGISGIKSVSKRLEDHKRQGWSTIKTWEATGGVVINGERAVLRWWRITLNAPVVKTSEDMPQGGWTETASTRKVGLQRTIDYIEELAA